MKQSNLRRLLLTIIVLPLVAVMIPIELHNLHDTALIIYWLCVIFTGICTVIWGAWWLFSRQPATTIFKVFFLILASFFYALAFSLYGRWAYIYDPVWHDILLHKWFWVYRFTPLLLVFMWLFCWIVARIFGTQDKGADVMGIGSIKVLIVDDEKGVCDVMAQSLNSLGIFEITCCNSIACAKEVFQPGKFVCVIVDLNLGTSTDDGIALALELRKLDPDIFIGVVSGYFKEAMDERLMLVVDDFMQKPFDLHTFKLKVFLWAIKYRRRLEIKQYVDESDFQVKSEIIRTIDEKMKKFFLK